MEENKTNELNEQETQSNDIVQNNEQVIAKEPKKGNGVIIGLLIILIMGLAGFIIYDKLIKKDDTLKKDEPTPTPVVTPEIHGTPEPTSAPENTPEPSNTSSNVDYNNLAGVTFKTSDGKKSLKIVSKDDSEAKKKAKSYGYDVNNNPEPGMSYFAYYNDNDLFVVYEESQFESTSLKYHVLGSRRLKSGAGQCRDSHEFIVNKNDNSLVDLDYNANDDYGFDYIVNSVGDKYYFSEGDCAMAFIPSKVYDENLKNIGTYFFGGDDNENIYVLEKEDGNIVKYDKNGNVLKKSNAKYNHHNINDISLINNETLYIVAMIDNQIYLVDTMSEDKYALNDVDDYFGSIGSDFPSMIIKSENDIIKLCHTDYGQNGEAIENVLYTFNPQTKELIKK